MSRVIVSLASIVPNPLPGCTSTYYTSATQQICICIITTTQPVLVAYWAKHHYRPQCLLG